MSEEADPLPETIDELIASILGSTGRALRDPAQPAAATAKIATLLMRDGLVPTLQGLTQELADTRTVLADTSRASTQYARALVRVTWGLVGVTVVLVLATVACLIWGNG
jgi:hypothetical protein